MKGLVARSVLAVAGAISSAIGAYILLAPHDFYATNHIILGTDVNLLSEVRASGGLLLAGGLYMLWAMFDKMNLRRGLWLGAGLYGAYGLARVYAVIVDGIPSSSLLAAAGIELVLALILSVAAMREKNKEKTN